MSATGAIFTASLYSTIIMKFMAFNNTGQIIPAVTENPAGEDRKALRFLYISLTGIIVNFRYTCILWQTVV